MTSAGLPSFVVRRLVQLLPVALAIAALNFVLVHLAPGDVAQMLAGQSGQASAEYVQRLRHEFGLDRPLYEQFFVYVGRLLTFDLGYSFVQQGPVLRLILDRLPATLLLMTTSIVLAVAVGIVLGVTAARSYGRLLDSVISVAALVCYATPVFWLGLVLIVLFSVRLGWLPPDGMTDTSRSARGAAYALDVLHHLVLPAISLALFYVAVYARLARSSMLEVLGSDFITAARAKGLGERAVAWRHAVPNAVLPVITIAGVMFGNMLGGSVLVETVFGWPGIGRLIFDALLQRDLNLLLGILFVSSFVVVVATLLVDVAYGLIDPRIVHK